MSVAPVVPTTTYELVGVNVGPFATVFPYDVHTDVLVYLDLGDGPALLAEGPDYTLTPTLPTLTNGGSVTLDAALAGAGWPANLLPGAPADVNMPSVILLRDTPDGQPSSFGEMDSFSPQAWEAALDNLSRQQQELQEGLSRTVQDRPGPGGWSVPDEIPRANHLVGFDPFGAWTLYPMSDFGGANFSIIGAPYVMTFPLAGAPPVANEPFPDHPLPYDVQLPANFALAVFTGARVLPAADYEVSFADQNGNPKGTITFHADGTITPATPGGAVVNFARGDVARPTGQAVPDVDIAGISITLVGKITG